MKNKMFKMLRIYEQDFPEKMLAATKEDVITHYYKTLHRAGDYEISDSNNNCKGKCNRS